MARKRTTSILSPREWLEKTKQIFAQFPIDREYPAKNGVDIDFWVPQTWLLENLQNYLDRLPAPATLRLTIVADVAAGGSRTKQEVSFNAETDELIEENMSFRPTTGIGTERGSALINRVYGEKGGFSRLASAYGAENISPLVRLELRYPPE